MAEDIEFAGGLWAIVGSGGHRYIGRITEGGPDAEGGHHIDPIEGVTLSPAYELTTFNRPIQVGPGKVAISRDTNMFPIDTCTRDTTIHLMNLSDYVLMSELDPADRRSYELQINAVRAEILAARAQQVGLASPPPGFDPSRFRGGPGPGGARA